MKTTISNGEIKRQNRIKTAQYIFEHRMVSRQEIAAALGFSLPTVFQNVTELIDWGMVCESGEYGSTGGRKAKVLKIREGFRCVAGAEITAHHVRLILMDLNWSLMAAEQVSLVYENSSEYYEALGEQIAQFIRRNGIGPDNPCELIGVGISLPGIIDHDLGVLRQSYALNVMNVSIRLFAQNIHYDYCFESAAGNAAYAELENKQNNTVYLSLNDTVDGAAYFDGEIYHGDNFKGAEFGHMILVPDGRPCYCGKKGCLDAYCAARVLNKDNTRTLDDFFSDLEKKKAEAVQLWDEYLEHLALAVSNLRMAFDCDIILGGHVGGRMAKYLRELETKIRRYNKLDLDISYIRTGRFKKESSAIGAARQMVDRYLSRLPVF